MTKQKTKTVIKTIAPLKNVMSVVFPEGDDATPEKIDSTLLTCSSENINICAKRGHLTFDIVFSRIRKFEEKHEDYLNSREKIKGIKINHDYQYAEIKRTLDNIEQEKNSSETDLNRLLLQVFWLGHQSSSIDHTYLTEMVLDTKDKQKSSGKTKPWINGMLDYLKLKLESEPTKKTKKGITLDPNNRSFVDRILREAIEHRNNTFLSKWTNEEATKTWLAENISKLLNAKNTP